MGTNDLSRRAFLSPKIQGDRITIRTGGHGDKVGLLGYGMMRLPTVDGKHANGWVSEGYSDRPIDQEEVNRQIDYALAHGVNYFDTAPVYCKGQSETVTGKALARHNRKDFLIATKLSNFASSKWSLKACQEMFESSLNALQVSYLDYYLLHSIGNGSGSLSGFDTFQKRFVTNGVLDWLLEARQKGRIRNLGFSYHGDVRAFNWCMEHHEKYHWDMCQIQLNYLDWLHAHEVNPRNQNACWLYQQLDARQIPVVVMEPLLGGRLARYNAALAQKLLPLAPETTLAQWAFRFAGHHPRVMTCLSGMTKIEHLRENCATFAPLKPLSEKELQLLEEAAQIYLGGKTIPCNECQYCMPCPYGLDIPGILGFWNRAVAERRLPDDPSAHDFKAKRLAFLRAYNQKIPRLRQASRCTACGKCNPHCPQAIDIPKQLENINAFVEDLLRSLRR